MKILLILTTVLAVILVGSCGSNVDEPCVASKPASWETELASSSEVQELIAMQDHIASSFYGLPLDELSEAVSDPEKAKEITGYDDWEERISRISKSLYSKFPELNAYGAPEPPCTVSEGAELLEKLYVSNKSHLPLLANKKQPVTCQWGPYVVNLIACTALGPGGYWVCAYLALCSWCYGGWVDNICR